MIEGAQAAPELALVRRRPPAHVEYLRRRAKLTLGVFVAAEAPLHAERRLPLGERHLVDPAVAAAAADAFGDVNGMIEVDEVGQLVHAVPGQRRATGESRAQRREHRRRL